MGSQTLDNRIGKVLIIVVLILITQLLFAGQSYAYSLEVHTKITEEVIDQNHIVIDDYLKNIGLNYGLTEYLEANIDGVPVVKNIRDWIEFGSWAEDLNWTIINNPLLSHFYEPISNESGVGLNIPPSAYEWADHPSNKWSWSKAREYLYTGLTLTTKAERDNALADSFRAIGHIMITITSPTDGQTIGKPYVMVKGTVTNTTGNETGVTVNLPTGQAGGMVATLYGGEFFVNNVPLEAGENTITANAIDTAGNMATDSITVTADTTADYVRINI